MTSVQVPIKKPTQYGLYVFLALFGLSMAALFAGLACMIVSYEPVTGSITLVALCTSIFCSYRQGQKQSKLRDRELRVRLDTPREGLAIVAGIVELPPQSNPITCEITGRECVAYSFTLHEMTGNNSRTNSRGRRVNHWEVFNESQSVPFVIRSEYGTARVIGPLEPAPSTIASFSSYADTRFLERNQLTQKSLCTRNGLLSQGYAEVMPGQFVTLLGKLSVDTDGGALLKDAEFSTQAKPVFEVLSSAANLERLPLVHKLGLVIPSAYLLWMLFTS
jgi:hypothetical protein